MTDQEGDRLYYLIRQIQGVLGKWAVARGEAEGDRPFCQTPPNLESQTESVSPEGLVIICFIIPPLMVILI